MPGKETPHFAGTVLVHVHGIVPGCAVNVDVNQAGCEDCIREIDGAWGAFETCSWADSDDLAVFDENGGFGERFEGSDDCSRSEESTHSRIVRKVKGRGQRAKNKTAATKSQGRGGGAPALQIQGV